MSRLSEKEVKSIMKRIPLSQSKFALVDDEDYQLMTDLANSSRYGKWRLNNCGYARLGINGTYLLMHRLIMDAPVGKDVDHINRNKLDNRKENLRVCTAQENSRNSKVSIRNTSGITGVHYKPSHRSWQARITVDYKRISLGYFKNIEDAVRIRRKAEVEYFKDFANNNLERVG